MTPSTMTLVTTRCFDTPCPRCGKSDGWGEFPSGAIIIKETECFKIEISTCCPGRRHLKWEDAGRVKAAMRARKWSDEIINEYFPGACPCGIDRRDCTYHQVQS